MGLFIPGASQECQEGGHVEHYRTVVGTVRSRQGYDVTSIKKIVRRERKQ